MSGKGHVSLGFVVNRRYLTHRADHLRSDGISCKAGCGIAWFLVGERLGEEGRDFELTVAGCKPVELSGRWVGEFHWEDLVTPTVLR